MLDQVEMKVSSNMYAIDLDSFRMLKDRWEISPKGIGYRDPGRKEFVGYHFKAYFFSMNQNTKGALCYGDLRILFDNRVARLYDGLASYNDLKVEDVLDYAENTQDKSKQISTYSSALFGNGRVWSSGANDEIFRNLVDAWFELPEHPRGTDGWFKKVRNG